MIQTNKKGILFCINKLGVGGAERVFIKDANSLLELGYEVFFCIIFGQKEDQKLLSNLQIGHENVFYAQARSFFDFNSISRVSEFINKNNIKTVYSTLNEANIFSRLIKFWSWKLNIIIREANVAGPKPIKFKFLDLILNLFVKKIVCVSEEVKKSLNKYQPFYSYKMEILMNGVHIPDIRKNYDNTSLPFKLLNVASLTPKKGQRFLIEALSVVETKYPNSFRLTIVGGGAEKKNLERQIQDLNLTDKVIIIDPVSLDELQKYYLDADIFVLSSLWEGFPNVLLEAMSFGLTSVSSSVSGANSIIENNVSGILVPPGNSNLLANNLLYLRLNPKELSVLGLNARNRAAQNFSYNAHLKRLISFLK